MIEKMKRISIITNLENVNFVIDKYILKYDIQLEEASKEYKNVQNYTVVNKYTEYYKKIEKIVNIVGSDNNIFKNIEEEEAIKIIDKVNDFYIQRDQNIKILEERKHNLEDIIKKLQYYIKLDFDMKDISKFKFIKCNFGKIPIDNFKQFKMYLYNNTNIIFVESMRDEKDIYCMCFYREDSSNDSSNNNTKILLDSLNFELIHIPFEFDNKKFVGSPMEIYKNLQEIMNKEKEEIDRLYKETLLEAKISREDILNAYNKIRKLYFNCDIKKYSAKIADDFCIFVGWISENEAKNINKNIKNDNEFIIKNDDKVIIKIEDYKESIASVPPTKLKNKFLFRPFEFFVKTYGIPKYNEIDPTPFLAITYTLIFGMMFGDVGQGFVISMIGLVLYKLKKIESSLIMVIVGISSMFFGFLYGSIFGFEELIPTLWLKPSENINNILLTAISIGVILTILSMILNMINAFKEKNKLRLLLSSNGVAGITFYIGSIATIAAFFYKNLILARILLVVFVIIPITLIAFRKSIGRKLEPNKKIIKENKIMAFLETFIELFEILLTYFTNTLSFVRIGAFALSHEGMMSVILLLAKNDNGGYNPLTIILGNILVIVVESVIVSIQVLRIQFYEMFSRYYTGGGREFEPYNKKIKDKSIDIR